MSESALRITAIIYFFDFQLLSTFVMNLFVTFLKCQCLDVLFIIFLTVVFFDRNTLNNLTLKILPNHNNLFKPQHAITFPTILTPQETEASKIKNLINPAISKAIKAAYLEQAGN